MEHLISESFDGKHHLEYTDTGKSHIYKLDGKRCPGATTVGACYPKGEGLIKWMIKQGIQEYEARTQLNRAGAIGTVVHQYAEAHMKGEPFVMPDVEDSAIIQGCISQYDQWTAQHPHDKLGLAEVIMASTSLQVASKIDLLLYREEHDVRYPVIRDYKTSKRIYVSALQQTALYRLMLREWYNIHCDVLEIVKFSKEPDTVPFESCVADNHGLTINGSFYEHKGLLDELEAQATRNVGTYQHVRKVEKLLNTHYGY